MAGEDCAAIEWFSKLQSIVLVKCLHENSNENKNVFTIMIGIEILIEN